MFAYGTLQPGLAPAAIRPVIDRLVLIGSATTTGSIYDLGSYPGAIFGGDAILHGTVYRFPAEGEAATLAALDRYEGVPDLYVRIAVPVTLTDGQTLTCWAYQYNRDLTGRAPIPTGRFAPEPRA